MLKPVTSPLLAAFPGIRHGFFTREGGVSEGLYAGLNCGLGSSDVTERVRENRARVAAHLGGRGEDVTTVYQVHSARAVIVDRALPRDLLPQADGVVTSTPGLAIGVLTADCTPVLFADPAARVVGAAHAGWKGALGGVLAATIEQMEIGGARRERIVASIGPTISAASYEVGPEFRAQFEAAQSSSGQFFSVPPGRFREHFDLPGFVAAQLARLGLAAIERCAPCTYANESLFFSFRRTTHRGEPDYGRQISAIVVT